MSSRKVKRHIPLRSTEIVELVNLPDGDESEDDLNNYESEEEGVQSSVSNISAASTSSSVSVTKNPSTSNLDQNIGSGVFVDIDSIFDNEDDWSSSDEEPLEKYRRIGTTQHHDVHDDAELCVSDNDSEEQENDSDCEETEWKKRNLEQLPEITKIFEEDGFDKDIYPNYFFSIVSLPIEFFERFFDTEIIDLITEQTNLYARQKQSKNWTDTNRTEIKALLGIHMLMSLHPLHEETQYWSTNPLYHVQVIADVMPLKRYKKLMECLHVNDNTKAPSREEPRYDKLFKLRPMIDLLNDRFSKECTLSKSHSIDECMVKFKGRSSLKQYMPMKPVKRGYKVWARADAKTGYLYEFEVYSGKTEGIVEVGLGPNVVLRLSDAIKHKGCHVTFDNFFTSVALMRDLYNQGIFSTGTVRTDRIGLPKIIKKKNSMQKHEFKWRVETTSGNIGYVQWKDTKPVSVLTTGFDPKVIVDVKRTQKDGNKALIKCPLAIAQYTKRMGGVDQFDQFRSHYKLGRRSNKWWMRLFYFLVESASINAFILYKAVHKGKKISQQKFRERLAYGLLDGYTSRKRTAELSWKRSTSTISQPDDDASKKSGVPREIRYSQLGVHWPEELPSFRRCHVCSTNTRNKRSRFRCSKCLVTLCVTPCFYKFHHQ